MRLKNSLVPILQGIFRAYLTKPYAPDSPREISPTRILMTVSFLLSFWHGSLLLNYCERLFFHDRTAFVQSLPYALGILTALIGVPASLAGVQKILDSRNGTPKCDTK